MKICGLKLTHDGAVALIDGNKLLFSIELEKLRNNPRYKELDDTLLVREVLASEGYSPDDIDVFAIDGWGGYDQDALAIQPRLQIGEMHNFLTARNGEKGFSLPVAQYRERQLNADVLESWTFVGLEIGDKNYSYESYLHVTGHIMSAYATSPFAARGEEAFVLIWDGGMFPRMYHFDPVKKTVRNLGPLFLLIGNIYTIFSQHFGPFKVKGGFAKDDLSIAGKVMAYIAKGENREELWPHFEEIYKKSFDAPMGFANKFAAEFKQRIEGQSFSDEDILCSFHHYLGDLLLQKLTKKIKRQAKGTPNLCMAGGCALNIKWNSLIRRSGLFASVYVPPFPNDSGSAIGAACAAMLHHTGHVAVNWDVYSGPKPEEQIPEAGWTSTDCSLEELARLLHEKNEPVVFLNGRAELGPRALGNRSIIAAPVSNAMKGILNEVKDRESYRPVSPICLEEDAPGIFEPGSPDPYMLFDHMVREEWLDRIPAICHLDRSARLQTITEQRNPEIARLLKAYKDLSGVPMLCNTSANHKGSGFFPDVRSVTDWGRVNYVWSAGKLYTKTKRVEFTHILQDQEDLIS
ncbi:MAG: carbamoyltransferase N-terminal domain-containing protein [Cyclobacteriaceae bacterium]